MEEKTRKDEIIARKKEIEVEVKSTDDLEKIETLNREVEALNEEEKQITEHEANEMLSKEIEEKKAIVKEVVKEEKKMENNKEFRNSKEYIEAFANYIKTNDDKELRALITTGGYATGNSATVEIPDVVYDTVKTAWEREELIQYVRTVSVKGTLKVQFEVSADGATVHQEGNGAVSEESLVLGVVSLPAKSIKKWISISDEVISMRGEDFLRYIYDEITYRIAKKCADELIAIIKQLPSSLSANGETGVYDKVSANKISKAPGIGVIAEAVANLSDEATNPIIVMNKLTFGAFKEAQYAANYVVDPFEGYKVVFNNTLPAYSAASANGVYAIVGDFEQGALLNFPDGEETEMKYDDKTQMEYDLVRILGRKYVGMNAVADKAFCLIAKPSVSQ